MKQRTFSSVEISMERERARLPGGCEKNRLRQGQFTGKKNG